MPDPANNRAALDCVLVTGATGLVGNNMVRALLERGSRVRALVRTTSDPRPLAGLDVELVTGDVTDADSVNRAAHRTTAVVHAAGCVLLGRRNAALHDRVNRLGTEHAARAARAAAARFVYVSSVNALGVGSWDRPGDELSVAGPNVPCPYVLSKQAGQRAVEAEIREGLDGMIVYPGFMLGPYDWKPSSGRMLLQLARGFVPFAPVGGFSVGDVRDVVHGILAALMTAPAGRHYVLAGHNVSYLEAWRRFARVAGRRGPWGRSGPLMRKGAGLVGDLWGYVTGREPDLNSVAVQLSDRCHCFSSARAEAELGYQIRPLDTLIADAWHWLQEVGYA